MIPVADAIMMMLGFGGFVVSLIEVVVDIVIAINGRDKKSRH